MKTGVTYKTFGQLGLADFLIYSKLPRHPFWSTVEEKIDFTFADKMCSFLYTGRGQYPYAPSLKLKIHLLQAYYALSDRQTEEKIMGDLFIKRFLGLPVDFFGFDHSTIGLDRTRMGTGLFQACHLYILAQMYHLQLWGNEDAWIIDSFPVQVRMTKMSAYRMIQQVAQQLTQLLKRYQPRIHTELEHVMEVNAFAPLPAQERSKADYLLAYSKMTTQAYGLLVWLNAHETLRAPWEQAKAQRRFHKRVAVLAQLLEENTVPTPPDAPPNSDADSSAKEEQVRSRRPYNERPTSRVLGLRDPDARIGKKGKHVTLGYKIQNLVTTRGVILETKVVSADEHDSHAMVGMVRDIVHAFKVLPPSLLADTLYGYGKQRKQLEALSIPLVAPVPQPSNPKKLLDHTHFTYDGEADNYLCPQGKRTNRKSAVKASAGWQYKFNRKDCSSCPLQASCTTNKLGRTVFHSDSHELYEKARAYNASLEGTAELGRRSRIEPKNNELKNHCKLDRSWTCSKEAMTMKTYLAATVVNLKLVARRLSPPGSRSLRRTA